MTFTCGEWLRSDTKRTASKRERSSYFPYRRKPMKFTAVVCTLTLSLAVPVASRCAAAAFPQQGSNRVAERTAEGKKANYASGNSLGLITEQVEEVAKEPN